MIRLLFLTLFLSSISVNYAQVHSVDSNKLESIIDAAHRENLQKQEEERKRRKEKQHSTEVAPQTALPEEKQMESIVNTPPPAEEIPLTTTETKKIFVYYDKLAESQVGYVTLSDGSFWAIESDDSAKALLWRRGQHVQVIISAEKSPVDSFDNQIINLDREIVVDAKLLELPEDPNSPLTALVSGHPVEVSKNELHNIKSNVLMGSIISLNNHAEFNINPMHMHIARHWKKGHKIRLSYNEDKLHPFTLYNVDTKEQVTGILQRAPSAPHNLNLYKHEEIYREDAMPHAEFHPAKTPKVRPYERQARHR